MTRRSAASKQLAGGRDLPRLLFVTHRADLDRSIGANGATDVLDLIREANEHRPRERRHAVLDYLGHDLNDRANVLREVHAFRIEQDTLGEIEGIVLLGSYDVVPAMRVDCLPASLREWVDAQPLDANDADDFTVWSDDPYGDPGSTGLPDIPVSRIPDGRSRELMLAALRAPVAETANRRGIRNVMRPFADDIFRLLPGDGEMLVSAPKNARAISPKELHASHVYIVLHGRHDIGRALWGERPRRVSGASDDSASADVHDDDARGNDRPLPRDMSDTQEMNAFEAIEDEMVEALRCGHMPGDGAVILSGCCWGAQVSASSARRWRKEGAPLPRRPGSSVALAALRDGARAFIGSTGMSYSPIDPVDHFYSEPLHREFWTNYIAGSPPALALLIAKHRYASGMPHGLRDDLSSRAIEHKTIHQYTCLGLGW